MDLLNGELNNGFCLLQEFLHIPFHSCAQYIYNPHKILPLLLNGYWWEGLASCNKKLPIWYENISFLSSCV